MGIDAYMQFTPYHGPILDSDSQIDAATMSKEGLGKGLQQGKLFELDDYHIEIEQTLNIGSQSVGAGAGKVNFHALRVTKKVDKATPVFFQNACSGTPFKVATLVHRRPATGANTHVIGLRYDFKLVAVKSLLWIPSEDRLKEVVTFEYGGLIVQYAPTLPDGKLSGTMAGGWNRIRNVADTNPDLAIA